MEKRERETEEESSKDMGGAARRYIPIEASRWMTKTRGREAPPVDARKKEGWEKLHVLRYLSASELLVSSVA